MDEGFDVRPGCEIKTDRRELYRQVCGGEPDYYELRELIDAIRTGKYGHKIWGIIGGPPCQAHSKLRYVTKKKDYSDLNDEVIELVQTVRPEWYLFENVVPIEIPGSCCSAKNAMHFYAPHQSRRRWFTHSSNINPPCETYTGTADDLMAYPAVTGCNYGVGRAAKLQGWDRASQLTAGYETIRSGLTNAVPYPLARAWAWAVKASMNGGHRDSMHG